MALGLKLSKCLVYIRIRIRNKSDDRSSGNRGEQINQTEDSLEGTDDDQTTGETGEPTTMANLRSPDLFCDDIYISGPSTSDHALEEANAEKETQKRRIAAYEGQLEEANAEKETLKRRIAA
ncbi:hypothetical protein GQX74_010977 [Glossina fuscipes]|nr:hypothetical protein GQX74_010977 [Glossina fuscipes]